MLRVSETQHLMYQRTMFKLSLLNIQMKNKLLISHFEPRQYGYELDCITRKNYTYYFKP